MILYSDFRRHKFDTHFIMMKVTFLLRNPVTLGFHGLSKADDDDDGNQNHNNNIYNTYLRWFPTPTHLPSIFPNPQNENHTLKGQMRLVHPRHQKHLQVTPVATPNVRCLPKHQWIKPGKKAPLAKGWGKKNTSTPKRKLSIFYFRS